MSPGLKKQEIIIRLSCVTETASLSLTVFGTLEGILESPIAVIAAPSQMDLVLDVSLTDDELSSRKSRSLTNGPLLYLLWLFGQLVLLYTDDLVPPLVSFPGVLAPWTLIKFCINLYN